MEICLLYINPMYIVNSLLIVEKCERSISSGSTLFAKAKIFEDYNPSIYPVEHPKCIVSLYQIRRRNPLVRIGLPVASRKTMHNNEIILLREITNCSTKHRFVFVAVFLGCTSTGRVGLCFLWFYVQELPKAQPAVVLVLKRLRRRGNGLKSHPTDWEKPGIEPATPGLQDIGLSPTTRRLLAKHRFWE